MNSVLAGFTMGKVARPLNTLNKSVGGVGGGAGGGVKDGMTVPVLEGFTTGKVARPLKTLNKSGAGAGAGAEAVGPIEVVPFVFAFNVFALGYFILACHQKKNTSFIPDGGVIIHRHTRLNWCHP